MTTLKDIARLAKVSETTVSHVINKTRFVEADTKNRVQIAIKKLNYQPNLLARSLATGKTNTIGLVISDIKNPFYPEIIQGIEEVAVKNNYNIFLCNTDYDLEKGMNSINALIKRKVDGLIIASSQIDYAFLEEIIKRDVNLVLVDWGNKKAFSDTLHFDYYSGILESIDHLISLGHRKIFFISGPENYETSRVRMKSFIDAINQIKDHDIHYEIIKGNHKIKGGIKAIRKMLKEQLPTAIICSNDLTAIGAVLACKEEDIRIPESLSIIGLDNIKLTEIITPQLSTVELDRYKIGKVAMEFMINRIEKKEMDRQFYTFNTRLIIRNSTHKSRESDYL